jgi:serine/threonine protein kinase
MFAVKDGLPLLEQPYLRRHFYRERTESEATAFWDDVTSTLGILLLELCFNRTIASFARECEHAKSSHALHDEINLAKQWYRELSTRTDDDYDSAVHWCLETMTRTREIDNEWRQSMQDRVIRPLERLCENTISTSLALDFDKAAWALRRKFERLLIICKTHDEDSLYQTLALGEAYCPDNALISLVREESLLLKSVYVASRFCVLSQKNHFDTQALRADKIVIQNEAEEFYNGVSKQSVYQRMLGTFLLAMTNPPSKAWFKAWDRFASCCRGDEPHLSELVTTHFPLDGATIVRLFTGRSSAERTTPAINQERADMDTFRFSQYYFCAAQLARGTQLNDHSAYDRYAMRLPLTSIRRIGRGSSANVYRVIVHGGHHAEQDQELAMKVVSVGPNSPDEWRHTVWMKDQLLTHECIMRAKASFRLNRQILTFYEAAECDLHSYMTNKEPPPWLTRVDMLITILEVAHALDHLHRGLSENAETMACLHKDMKAENILVTWRPDKLLRLKITDFGISSTIHEKSLPREDSSGITLLYAPRERKIRTELGEGLHNAAPEMQNNGLINASADIWAFGTVLADYVAWLYSGRSGLEDFETAKSARYTDNAYFCTVNQRQDRSRSTSKKPTANKLAHFVLKREIEDWYESTIDHANKDESNSALDVKMLEDCWWLLKSRILVCNADERGKSEDILRWLREIVKGTFSRPAITEDLTAPSVIEESQSVREEIPTRVRRSKRKRVVSSLPTPHKKV